MIVYNFTYQQVINNFFKKHFTNVDKLCIIKNVNNPKPGKRVKNIILDYKGVQKT
nr:MAG TPA: hypothetical protein [Caudoviricetes sp.]